MREVLPVAHTGLLRQQIGLMVDRPEVDGRFRQQGTFSDMQG